MKHKQNIVWILIAFIMVVLTGCEYESKYLVDHDMGYPIVEYQNSSWNFDRLNRAIPVEDGFALDEGHSYDIVETDSGYDIILHFKKYDGGADNAAD